MFHKYIFFAFISTFFKLNAATTAENIGKLQFVNMPEI
jgi:hypothetical protein